VIPGNGFCSKFYRVLYALEQQKEHICLWGALRPFFLFQPHGAKAEASKVSKNYMLAGAFQADEPSETMEMSCFSGDTYDRYPPEN